MPSGSTIVIDVDGTDITQHVLPGSVRIESQLNAIPGVWEMTVKDLGHTLSYITGRRMKLTVDGTVLAGGYVTQVTRTYPFPAMDTTNHAPTIVPRYWKIRGVDFNVLFDKRVLRYPTNYTGQIPGFAAGSLDGVLVRQLWADYLDKPSYVDATTYVDDVGVADLNSAVGAWRTQGDKARLQMQDLSQFTGAVWYFDADANLHYHALEDVVKRWGFSDQPNHNAITVSPNDYQGATIGPREIEATEDASRMVNDALIWGGSPLGSTAGGVLFARAQNSTSISDHDRWQLAELHFGESPYGVQAGVDARADIIVNGSPASQTGGQQKGLKDPQWQFKFAWYAHQVPMLSGVRDHIRPGYVATITLKVFGPSGSPLVQVLPLRQVVISIPSLDPTGKGYVRFDGLFGLQLDDPFTLWQFLLKQKQKVTSPTAVITTGGSGGSYNDTGEFTPTPVPDGSATVFTIPFGYISNTTEVYLFQPGVKGGVLLRRGVDYTESSPSAGQITITPALPSGDSLLVRCRITG